MSDNDQINEFANAVLEQEPVSKPKRARTAKQLEAARRNMELGRQKRLANLAKKKAEKMAPSFARSEQNISELSGSDNDDYEDSSDEEFEELVYETAPKHNVVINPPKREKRQKGGADQDVISKMMADISSIKEYMTNDKAHKASNTIIKIQTPQTQAPQPTESVEAVQQRKKILMHFGGNR